MISSPHSGTGFPDAVKPQIEEKFIKSPEDTDWHIDRLYDFAPEMGITLVTAKYSRYVIDLNRRRDSKALYSDSRQLTQLVPSHTFSGEHISPGIPITDEEIQQRVSNYYDPYYEFIERELKELQQIHKHVLFFDAHSIKKTVKSIQQEPFADFILGDNDKSSADIQLIEAASGVLNSNPKYEFSHNTPFKGGHLTRHFGRPSENIHALQLEMSQQSYLDEENPMYLESRAEPVRQILKRLFSKLHDVLKAMP